MQHTFPPPAQRAAWRWLHGLLCATAALSVLGGCGGGGGGGAGAAAGAAGGPVGAVPSTITVTSAPASQTVADGQSADLSVLASGSSRLTYQWLRNGVALAGAVDPRYVTPALSMADDGVRYSVALGDGISTPAIRTAIITIRPVPPTVTEQPQAQTAVVGQRASFEVQALGSLPLGYQWQRDGVDIAGATSASLSTPALTSADNGAHYRAIVRNAAGEVTTRDASLQVSSGGPVVLRFIQVGVVAAGQTVVITSTLAGTPPFDYQWLRNGEPVEGAAGSSGSASLSLTTPPLFAADDGVRYALSVSSAGGQARSSDAVISVVGTPRVAAGGAHSLARSADGRTVWSWGDNRRGQLGAGTITSSATPLVVGGLPAVKAIAAGAEHSMALAVDGTVWAWGGNGNGELGDGTTADRRTPQRVGGLGEVIAIAAGTGRSFALRADGSLWGWGENATGALGLGTLEAALAPVQVGQATAGFGAIVAVATGARHTLALRADGQVFVVGETVLPPATATVRLLSPVRVEGISSISSISAGDGFSVALDINGRLWSWGSNGSGQLGLGTTAAGALPTLIASTRAGDRLLPSLGLAAGADFALAQPLAGAVLAWGAGASGQLGTGGSAADTPAPVAVGALPMAIVSIAAGRGHALAVLADGTVYAWGSNAAGQLGIGSSELLRSEPVQVPALDLD